MMKPSDVNLSYLPTFIKGVRATMDEIEAISVRTDTSDAAKQEKIAGILNRDEF